MSTGGIPGRHKSVSCRFFKQQVSFITYIASSVSELPGSIHSWCQGLNPTAATATQAAWYRQVMTGAILTGARWASDLVAPFDYEDSHSSVSPLSNSFRTARNRRIARGVCWLWKDFTYRRIQRRALALSGIRKCLGNHTDEQLANTILAFVVEFQPAQQRVFETNPHKESRIRAIQYFIWRRAQSQQSRDNIIRGPHGEYL